VQKPGGPSAKSRHIGEGQYRKMIKQNFTRVSFLDAVTATKALRLGSLHRSKFGRRAPELLRTVCVQNLQFSRQTSNASPPITPAHSSHKNLSFSSKSWFRYRFSRSSAAFQFGRGRQISLTNHTVHRFDSQDDTLNRIHCNPT